MTNLRNYKKDFLSGDIRDLKLFVGQLDSFPKDESGLTDLALIVSNVLETPISSIFCDGKFTKITTKKAHVFQPWEYAKISEPIAIIDNDVIVEYRVRFEIYYENGISYKQFEKLTDELYLRFELTKVISEIGLVENLNK